MGERTARPDRRAACGLPQAGQGVTAPAWQAGLAKLGLELPPVAPPVAVYVPAVRTGSLVYTSGQLPFVGGALPRTGKVGADLDTAEAAELAKLCALNALAAVHDLVGLDSVVRVVKVVGFVASAPGYTDQPLVVNGASEFLGAVLGDAGVHARSAVGVSELPKNSPVEVEIIAEVR
ncbi:MAG: RidA family protein [Mycobacteriaceae bacterium]|nr:RidA family protein [Mycobacteriaceae bacterium]